MDELPLQTVEQDGLGFRLLLREDPSTMMRSFAPWVAGVFVAVLAVFYVSAVAAMLAIPVLLFVLALLAERLTRLDLRVEGRTATLYRNDERIWSGPTGELSVHDEGRGWHLKVGARTFVVLNSDADQQYIRRLADTGEADEVPAALGRVRQRE